jgi:16S rRNA (guanine527-N7)-methyltransferase
VSQAQVIQFEALLNQGGNGREFSDKETQQLLAYYQLVLKWNNRLHLTTLTRPEQFFQRHILESVLTASSLIPAVRQIWDLGSGLGIPGIPLAILRPDLSVHLVESSRKKALFLEEVIATLGLADANVIAARIESLEKLPNDSCLTARAVEKMERLIKQMLTIGQDSAQMLFLGSVDLKKEVAENLDEGWVVQSQPIAGTERRMLINVIRST